MRVVELGRRGDMAERALVFETDDEVVSTLEAFARANAIRAARFSALGAFRSATLAYFEWDAREYRELPVTEQVEVASLTGDIALDRDGVVVHAHCVLGHADGTAIAGHLIEARVRPTLELFLTSYDTTLARVHDDDAGLALIRGDGELLP